MYARDARGFLGVPTGWEQSPETCASWAWGLGPSGGCWWEVRDKFWLLSGPLPTAVPRAMVASPTGRWSGLQLSLPKRFLEPVSESISTETLTLRKRLYVFVWKLMYLKWTSPGIGRSHLEGMWGSYTGQARLTYFLPSIIVPSLLSLQAWGTFSKRPFNPWAGILRAVPAGSI